jgi:hypothetical protein
MSQEKGYAELRKKAVKLQKELQLLPGVLLHLSRSMKDS